MGNLLRVPIAGQKYKIILAQMINYNHVIRQVFVCLFIFLVFSLSVSKITFCQV